MSVLAIAVLLLFCGKEGTSLSQDDTPSLVAENGADYSIKDGIHELGGGQGWVRSQRLYLNFKVRFDFRTFGHYSIQSY